MRKGLNIFDQVTVLGVMVVGMTAVIIVGGIDPSVGSVLALSSMVLGWMMRNAGLPPPISIVGAVLAGGACGMVMAC